MQFQFQGYEFDPFLHFPDVSDGGESVYKAGDSGLIPGSGRFPGEGNSYPLKYSYLDNSMYIAGRLQSMRQQGVGRD